MQIDLYILIKIAVCVAHIFGTTSLFMRAMEYWGNWGNQMLFTNYDSASQSSRQKVDCVPPAEEKTIARKTKAEVAHPRCMGSTIVSTAASRLLNVPCLVKQTLSATSLLG